MTSIFLSFSLMVQVVPEVRDWLWHQVLAPIRLKYRSIALCAAYLCCRSVMSAPWLSACSASSSHITLLGLRVHVSAATELFAALIGAGVMLGLLVGCLGRIWRWQARQALCRFPLGASGPEYRQEARLRPRGMALVSAELDSWLPALRQEYITLHYSML